MLMFQENPDASADQGIASSKVTKVDTSFSTGVIEGALNKSSETIEKWFSDRISKFTTIKGIYDTNKELDQEQAKLRATLGLGSQKADEFKKLVADGAAKFAQIGLDIDKVGATYTDLLNQFQADISISDQNLLELAATNKVTNVSVKDLAAGFRGVGISINEVGENMTQVAEIARQAGVSVAEVSKNVVANLEKMNLYNFEGGVKGLAKMSAQAARLGVDMKEIFKVVDKVFKPEGAIELAAAMQRLGVSAGALLDPLRLMDLSQNDPTELQNQIVNMSKDFVRFNKELGQFEIMPGEKRRLNEIGEALGLTSGELQKMAINAANLDMKMKQIRFPSSIASKEDRELIATLATVNKQGVAQIKVARLDEQGNKTGEYDMVEASQLTVEQLENIKKDQELRGRTMEEIAGDQLDELSKLNAQIDSFFKALQYGVGTRKETMGIYETALQKSRQFLFGDKTDEKAPKGIVPQQYKESQTYREMDLSFSQMQKLGTALLTDIKNIYSGIDLSNFNLGDITGTITNVGTKIKDVFGDAFNYMDELSNTFGIGGSETDPLSNFKNENVNINESISNINQKITSKTLSQNLNTIEFKPIDINENIKVDVNVTMDPNLQNQALTTLISQGVEKWFSGPESNNNINLIRQRIMDVENRYNLTGPRLTNKE